MHAGRLREKGGLRAEGGREGEEREGGERVEEEKAGRGGSRAFEDHP
jgi:hypothetical protein